MKGNTKIIVVLNQLLAGELGARDQYFQHSRMLANWGYEKMAARIAHEVEDESGHAGALIARILFLGGTPTVVPAPLTIGKDVPSMLKNDLASEYSVIANLRAAIAQCEAEHDYVSRQLLQGLLSDTENDHAYWLEQQLFLLEQLGLPNYLQSQMG
ncbi:MAG: bacterioferritin [Burkholderiales bacterium]|nr:bacterioferritin [Burkholderiales bacterium]